MKKNDKRKHNKGNKKWGNFFKYGKNLSDLEKDWGKALEARGVFEKCKNCKGGLSVCSCRCHKFGTQRAGCDEPLKPKSSNDWKEEFDNYVKRFPQYYCDDMKVCCNLAKDFIQELFTNQVKEIEEAVVPPKIIMHKGSGFLKYFNSKQVSDDFKNGYNEAIKDMKENFKKFKEV